MTVEAIQYPYRVALLDHMSQRRKELLCRTAVGAHWILGNYRQESVTVYLEEWDSTLGRYKYTRSLGLTEYR